ncbi:MAG: molybdate ABC transporter permease subunit, partial [Hylemonella sp.]
IAAGVVLGFARSLGEFGATITFAGNYPGVTQTMPTLIYQELQADQEAARVLSLVMLILSIAVLAGLRDHWLVPAVGRT